MGLIVKSFMLFWMGIAMTWLSAACGTESLAPMKWAAGMVLSALVDVLFAFGRF
jgi:hypothetical protein